MSVVDGVRVAGAFGERRDDDHADRPVAAFALVPGDEDRAAALVGRRAHDFWNLVREPGIALQDRVIPRGAGIVRVIAEIGSDEDVLRDGIALQVGGELGVGADVGDAIGRVGVVGVGDVVEVDERIMLRSIRIDRRQQAVGAADVLLIGLPGNAGVLELCGEMAGGALMVRAGSIVIQDPEVGAGLEPEVVGKTGMDSRRIEILLGAGGHRQEGVVGVGSRRAAFDLRPVMILHQDDEDGLHIGELCAGRNGGKQRQVE